MHHGKRKLILLLKLLIAGGLIAWLFTSGKIRFSDLENVGDGWPWFIAALFPFGLVLFICGYRWRLLLRAQGARYTLRDALAITLIGHFFNQFLIGTTGGDMVKAYLAAVDHPERRGAAIMSVFMDRAIGLLVLIAVALGAIAFNLDMIRREPRLTFLALVVAGVFAASIAGGYVFYSDRVRSLSSIRWLLARLPFRSVTGRVADAVYVYKFHPKEVAAAVLLSVGVHALIIVMHLALARSLIRGPLPWVSFFFLIPLAQIAMAIPINPPGAIGTGEWIYATLLPFVGVPQGALICLLQRFVLYAWALAGCAAYLRRRAVVKEAVKKARAADEEEDRDDKAAGCPGSVGGDDGAAHGCRRVRSGVDTGAR